MTYLIIAHDEHGNPSIIAGYNNELEAIQFVANYTSEFGIEDELAIYKAL